MSKLVEGLRDFVEDPGPAQVLRIRHSEAKELLAHIERLDADIDRLKSALADDITAKTMLREMYASDGGLNMRIEGGACALLIDAFAEQFKSAGSDNYLELGFYHGELGPIIVTVQRQAGKTPAQLRQEAEDKAGRLQAQLAEAKNLYLHERTEGLTDQEQQEEWDDAEEYFDRMIKAIHKPQSVGASAVGIATQETVQEGFVVVPKEPTVAMLESACDEHKAGEGECVKMKAARNLWARMIKAAGQA